MEEDNYKSPYNDVSDEIKEVILSKIRTESKKKPWTLVGEISRNSEFSENEIRVALKQILTDKSSGIRINYEGCLIDDS